MNDYLNDIKKWYLSSSYSLKRYDPEGRFTLLFYKKYNNKINIRMNYVKDNKMILNLNHLNVIDNFNLFEKIVNKIDIDFFHSKESYLRFVKLYLKEYAVLYKENKDKNVIYLENLGNKIIIKKFNEFTMFLYNDVDVLFIMNCLPPKEISELITKEILCYSKMEKKK